MITRNIRELNEQSPVSVIGLTGGIASGKTVATDALKAAGFRVIDADEVSRSLTAVGTPAEAELMKIFPEAVKENRLDRRKLRSVIAADRKKRAALNAYTHPLILGKIKELIKAVPPPAVLSAPLLFETALSSLCDCVICITAPRKTRTERLMLRDGVSRADAENIIDAQLEETVRVSLSDYCVPSDQSDRRSFEKEIVELVSALANIRK